MTKSAVCLIGGLFFTALLAESAARAAEPRRFVGSGQCKTCHAKAHASWETTEMAKSFEDLRPGNAAAAKQRAKLDVNRDYTTDSRCLACHSTGYRRAGGFVDEKTTPDLEGVGCEACHGAGSEYVRVMADRKATRAAFVAAGMLDRVDAAVCKGCHNSRTAAGTVIGSRHFVKQFVFDKTKDIHSHQP